MADTNCPVCGAPTTCDDETDLCASCYEKMLERELFSTIEKLGGTIWWMEHEIYHERLKATPDNLEFIKGLREEIKREVAKTEQFGVDFNEDHSYWNWYHKMKYGTPLPR